MPKPNFKWDKLSTISSPWLRGKKSNKVTIWQLIFVSPIMLAILAGGIWALQDSLQYKFDGIETAGYVTKVEITQDDGVNKYRPTFKFHDKDGEIQEKRAGMSSSTRYEEKQKVDVIYLAKDPDKYAKINTFMNLWFLPILLLSISILGELGLVFGYRKTKNMPTQTYSPSGKVSQNPLLISGATVKSRYWQTVRAGHERRLEVQYVYENQSYKMRSQPLVEKQLKKLVPGEEVTLKVNKSDPSKSILII